MYSQYADDLVLFIISCTKSFLKQSATYTYSGDDDSMLDNLQSYLQSKYSGIIGATTIHDTPTFEGEYDIWAWSNEKEGPSLRAFKKNVVYNMSFSDEQKRMLEGLFGIYGNTIVGKVKVISKVMKWQNLVHSPQLSNQIPEEGLLAAC
jgi:hypothetical protein